MLLTAEMITSADDALKFCDADLRHYEETWYDGLRARKMFRIPRFTTRYATIRAEAEKEKIRSAEFADNFAFRANRFAKQLKEQATGDWTDGQFSKPQIDQARAGNQQLQRAIPAALALNEYADRYDLPKEDDSVRVRAHGIVVCAFYFADLRRLLDKAQAECRTILNDPEFDLEKEIAVKLGQPVQLINDLAGEAAPARVSSATLQRAAGSVASYRTQRAILKFLRRLPFMADDLVEDQGSGKRRDDIIRLYKLRDRLKTAYNDEIITDSRPITRPPYKWEDPLFDAGEWPLSSDGELSDRLRLAIHGPDPQLSSEHLPDFVD